MLLARTPRVFPAARIYEVLPLTCPFCRAPMRIIAFITEPSTVCRLLNHLSEATRPPRIAPARRPPLREATAAAARNDLGWDNTPPPAPAVEFDQRITWCGATPALPRYACVLAATNGEFRVRMRLGPAVARQKNADFRDDWKAQPDFGSGLRAQEYQDAT